MDLGVSSPGTRQATQNLDGIQVHKKLTVLALSLSQMQCVMKAGGRNEDTWLKSVSASEFKFVYLS